MSSLMDLINILSLVSFILVPDDAPKALSGIYVVKTGAAAENHLDIYYRVEIPICRETPLVVLIAPEI